MNDVTNETIRCLGIVTDLMKYASNVDTSRHDVYTEIRWGTVSKIIEGCPNIKQHPELLAIKEMIDSLDWEDDFDALQKETKC